jgi:hypothetical protein
MPELAPVRKTFFTIRKNGSAPRDALRVATALIRILTIAPVQGCPSSDFTIARALPKTPVLKMSILSPCFV